MFSEIYLFELASPCLSYRVTYLSDLLLTEYTYCLSYLPLAELLVCYLPVITWNGFHIDNSNEGCPIVAGVVYWSEYLYHISSAEH